jgi:hypothetical protein
MTADAFSLTPDRSHQHIHIRLLLHQKQLANLVINVCEPLEQLL